MVNKDEHIDDFLNQKFDNFESLPDDAAWDFISTDIEHLSHPIDHSLNHHLANFSAAPPNGKKMDILAYAAIDTHPIDITLHEKLSLFESIPDKHVYQDAIQKVQDKKQKKRRLILWIMMAVIIAGSAFVAGLLKRDTDKNNTLQAEYSKPRPDRQASNTNEQEKALVSPEPDLHDNNFRDELSQQKPESLKEMASPFSKANNHKRKKTEKQGKWNYPFKGVKIDNNETEHVNKTGIFMEQSSDQESLNIMKIMPYHLFKYRYEGLEFVKIRNKNNYPGLPKKRLSPFSINIQFGYANESAASSQLKTDNVHKDALSNFQKANDNSRHGDIISMNLGYRFSSRFVLKTGFQYSSTTVESSMDYTYTEVPFYQQGIITSYFTRPASQSPHIDEKVRTTTTSYAVPFQFYARIFEFKKLSVWTGIGSDLILKRTSSGRLFSFEDEEMKDFKNTSKNKFSPNLSFLFQYHLSPGIAITGNLQSSYFSSKINFENTRFVKHEILPSIRLGILFTPIIPAK